MVNGTFPIISPQGDGNEVGTRHAHDIAFLFRSFPRKGMETTYGFMNSTTFSGSLFRSFPRKGMETSKFPSTKARSKFFSDHFPARGWKPCTGMFTSAGREPLLRTFSDHFPARGWKREGSDFMESLMRVILFRSFPRKGMETIVSVRAAKGANPGSFSDHFPARGWKLLHRYSPLQTLLAFPIISPQGDGNLEVPLGRLA